MKLTKLSFEGTLEEYEAVAHQFENNAAVVHDTTPEETIPSEDEKLPDRETDKQLIRHMLRRLDVPRGQRDLYRVLHRARTEWITKSDLAQAMNRTERQFSGVVGALGGRVNGTPGVNDERGITLIIKISRKKNEWIYRLREEFLEILEEEEFQYLLDEPAQ